MLYDAITGSSSRLVITSLSPELPTAQWMTFGEYLQRMGEKFMPAAESIQMEAEYRDRKQGEYEDVQNYINAKRELFLLAFPNAQVRDRVEFYRETTEGFLNKYVRDQMFCHEPTDVESFGARAVNVVQIEKRRIRIGDSDSKGLDGLIPVTRPMWEGPWKRRRDMGVAGLCTPGSRRRATAKARTTTGSQRRGASRRGGAANPQRTSGAGAGRRPIWTSESR